ncbi:MAG: hypothetical protein IJA35_00635 [Clostridia bacterium]|nr:hypothetical protein [Clostridia bacterium]
MTNSIAYQTRDANGNDIAKMVEIKKHPSILVDEQTCPTCGQPMTKGIPTKKIVSANFTDWAYVGEYVCERCADLFSLYFYNYIVDPSGIRLLNVLLRRKYEVNSKRLFLRSGRSWLRIYGSGLRGDMGLRF